MRFPLEVVGVGKQNITGRSHIKYVDNMDLKNEIDDMDGKISTTQGERHKYHGWYHVRQQRYSNRGWTPSVTTHITKSKINTLIFWCGKTPMGKHPQPQPTQPLGAIY